jgi:hypothetical protein
MYRIGPEYQMAYLFNKPSQELDDPLESLNRKCRVSAEYAEHIDKLIVYCVVLGGELAEEHAGHVRDFLIAILQTLGHLAQLTLNLDLTSQDQERQGHKTRSLDTRVTIV